MIVSQKKLFHKSIITVPKYFRHQIIRYQVMFWVYGVPHTFVKKYRHIFNIAQMVYQFDQRLYF